MIITGSYSESLRKYQATLAVTEQEPGTTLNVRLT